MYRDIVISPCDRQRDDLVKVCCVQWSVCLGVDVECLLYITATRPDVCGCEFGCDCVDASFVLVVRLNDVDLRTIDDRLKTVICERFTSLG